MLTILNIYSMMILIAVFVMLARKFEHETGYGMFSLICAAGLALCVLLELALGFRLVILPLLLNAGACLCVIGFMYRREKMLYIDCLTGAFNRRYLEAYLRCSMQCPEPFSCIMIDLDHFKHINDTYGHAAGDLVLRTAVRLIKQCLCGGETVIRYGGDEFVIFIQAGNAEQLKSRAAFVLQTFEAYNRSAQIPITFSAGCGIFDCEKWDSAERFLSEIDMQMYRNKRARYRKSPGERPY